MFFTWFLMFTPTKKDFCPKPHQNKSDPKEQKTSFHWLSGMFETQIPWLTGDGYPFLLRHPGTNPLSMGYSGSCKGW